MHSVVAFCKTELTRIRCYRGEAVDAGSADTLLTFVVTQTPNMSLSAKRETLARIHGRYQRAGQPHTTRVLDEFCATCGYHRKVALRLLNRPFPGAAPSTATAVLAALRETVTQTSAKA
jgi:hypothetical protein